MSTYLGNSNNIFNWGKIITHLDKIKHPAFIEGKLIGTGFGSDEYPTYPEEIEHDLKILKKLTDANYNLDASQWYLYRAGEHYNNSLAESIAEYYKIKIKLGWISIFRLDPGCSAPMHFEDGVMEEDRQTTARIFIQMSPPENGQVLIIDSEVLHNVPSGDAYRWDHFLQEHAAANCSMNPWYFAFLQGVRTDL